MNPLFTLGLTLIAFATSISAQQRRADVRLVGGNVQARIVDPNGVDHYFVFQGAGVAGPVEIPATQASCASPVFFTIGPLNAHNHVHTIDWLDCKNTRHRWEIAIPVSSQWLAGTAHPVPAMYGFGCGMQAPMALDIDAPPTLGTNRTLAVTAVPPTTTAVGTFMSFTPTGNAYPLTAIGIPTSECYVFIDLGSALPLGLNLAPSATVTFPLGLPASPAFTGLIAQLQSVALSPGENPAGIVTSNGLSLVLAQ